MAKLFDQFQNFLLDSRKFLLSKFSIDEREIQEPEESLTELPSHLASQVATMVEELPSNNGDLEAIRVALDEAFDKWLANPQEADNSLLILSSPVTAVSRILLESLNNWAMERKVPLRPLEWVCRPIDTEDIAIKLRQQLGRGSLNTSLKEPEIVVIPNLSWCYLRCFAGLEGIDYLQDVLLQDHSRFWIIGSGLVGWEYLNCVSHFKAYCGESFILPELEGEQLQTWLEPIIDKLKIKFDRLDNDFANFDKNKDFQTKYFDKLARVSQGVSSVALMVFLNSIRYEPPNSDNDSDNNLDNNSGTLQAQNPQTPDLPRLLADDLYILYSLLLHGDLTLSALADTLGDEPSLVRSRIHTLRRQGIVEQSGNTITINPIHYPRLKSELSNNNFIINEFDE